MTETAVLFLQVINAALVQLRKDQKVERVARYIEGRQQALLEGITSDRDLTVPIVIAWPFRSTNSSSGQKFEPSTSSAI